MSTEGISRELRASLLGGAMVSKGYLDEFHREVSGEGNAEDAQGTTIWRTTRRSIPLFATSEYPPTMT
jgi:hypothetical protein